jgi:hypothetical protein
MWRLENRNAHPNSGIVLVDVGYESDLCSARCEFRGFCAQIQDCQLPLALASFKLKLNIVDGV